MEGGPAGLAVREIVGELIVDRGEWLGRPGDGRFLHRSAGEVV